MYVSFDSFLFTMQRNICIFPYYKKQSTYNIHKLRLQSAHDHLNQTFIIAHSQVKHLLATAIVFFF